MAPPGMYYMGSTYWAGSFGLGGDQTTWDSQTNTYSQNKDWLAGELYKSGKLAANWLVFFENHLECVNQTCTKVSGTGTDTCPTAGQPCGTPAQRYGCVNGQCMPQENGPYLEPTCGGDCQSVPPDSSKNTLLLIGAVVAAGIVYYFSQQKKKEQE